MKAPTVKTISIERVKHKQTRYRAVFLGHRYVLELDGIRERSFLRDLFGFTSRLLEAVEQGNVLDGLKQRNLIRKNPSYWELLNNVLPSQFSDSLIRLRTEGKNVVYCFDGVSISMECILSNGFFQVASFRRLDAFKREQHKRFFLEVPGQFHFLFSHKIATTPLPNNCSQILCNRVEDFQEDIHSQKTSTVSTTHSTASGGNLFKL